MDLIGLICCRYLRAMGLDPGLEFKVAMEEGERIGAQVVYGDHPIEGTMAKLASAMTAMDVIKMFASPFFKVNCC